MADQLKDAIRKIVREELNAALNGQLTAKVNGQIDAKLNGQLEAKVKAAVGNRLEVVDRLVAAIQNAPTTASSAASSASSRASTRKQRRALRRSVRRAAPTAQARRAKLASPSVSAKSASVSAKPASVSAKAPKSIPFKKGSGKKVSNPTVNAKVLIKQGKGTFRGFVKSKTKDGQFIVKREGDGKEFTRGADGLYAAA